MVHNIAIPLAVMSIVISSAYVNMSSHAPDQNIHMGTYRIVLLLKGMYVIRLHLYQAHINYRLPSGEFLTDTVTSNISFFQDMCVPTKISNNM